MQRNALSARTRKYATKATNAADRHKGQNAKIKTVRCFFCVRCVAYVLFHVKRKKLGELGFTNNKVLLFYFTPRLEQNEGS